MPCREVISVLLGAAVWRTYPDDCPITTSTSISAIRITIERRFSKSFIRFGDRID
jgi:hypothetical protein